jgi:ABC-type transport system substrate-binding protein
MRKMLTYSAVIVLMALGLAWSASAAAPAAPASTPAVAAQSSQAPLLSLDPAQGAVPMASCTVTCPWDPGISCTSASGNCKIGSIKGLDYIVCDGVRQICP